MRYYFLDKFDPMAKDSSAAVISLNPVVSYNLDKNNIKYNILEEYYDETALYNDNDKYFTEQLAWFDTFDAFLKKHIHIAAAKDIPLARASYLRLVYFLDTIAISSHMLLSFFSKKEDIDEIVYIGRLFENNDYFIFDIKSMSRKVFLDLLELFCKRRNIKLIIQNIDEQEYCYIQKPSQKHLLDYWAGGRFLKSQIKKLIFLIKYKKIRKIIFRSRCLKNLNILFMHTGTFDVDYPLTEALRHGASTYVLEGNSIVKEDTFLRKAVSVFVADDFHSERLEYECKKCADKLASEGKILTWLNKKCTYDVTSIVLPFLRQFISTDCCYILSVAEAAYQFYKKNKIDYIFARGNTDKFSLGFLIAGKYMGGAKNICTQHSSFATDVKVIGGFELETYNFTLTRDVISHNYYRHILENEYKCNCDLLQLPHYLRNVKKKFSSKVIKEKKERVVYVEAGFADRARCFNNVTYSFVWYYEFQKRLIDFFTRQPNFRFVYKHRAGPGQKWTRNSTLLYINDKMRINKKKNISIYKKHFLKSLKFADKVIVDSPTSALFESAVAGRPVLCICPRHFKLQEKAKDIFGKSLQQFSSIDEAFSIIRRFLHSSPEEYIVEVPFSDDAFIDVFQRIIKKEKAEDLCRLEKR